MDREPRLSVALSIEWTRCIPGLGLPGVDGVIGNSGARVTTGARSGLTTAPDARQMERDLKKRRTEWTGQNAPDRMDRTGGDQDDTCR